jgi:hypothetical protein
MPRLRLAGESGLVERDLQTVMQFKPELEIRQAIGPEERSGFLDLFERPGAGQIRR